MLIELSVFFKKIVSAIPIKEQQVVWWGAPVIYCMLKHHSVLTSHEIWPYPLIQPNYNCLVATELNGIHCFICSLLSFSVISIPTLAYDLSIVLHVKNHFAIQVHWRTTFDYIQRSPTNVSFAMKFSYVMTLLFVMNFATLVQNLLSVTFARLHLHLRTTLNVTCASTWVRKQWDVQLVEENAAIITVWDGTWQPIQVCVLNIRRCSWIGTVPLNNMFRFWTSKLQNFHQTHKTRLVPLSSSSKLLTTFLYIGYNSRSLASPITGSLSIALSYF